MFFSQKQKPKQARIEGESLPFPLFDMHCHMLCGVDDGAVDDVEMFRMIDLSYTDGIRGICFTPHFQYDLYGDNRAGSIAAFEKAKEYAAEKYPDLELYLGNELFYHTDAVGYLMSGECRTFNGSRYVLMDFDMHVELRTIEDAVQKLVCRGYRPVLAHPERYECFGTDVHRADKFCRGGCFLQVNASSFAGEWGRRTKKRAEKFLAAGMVFAIASDAHHVEFRRPGLSACAAAVGEMYGEDYARRLFYENPMRLLRNERV